MVNTFLPWPDLERSAKALDNKRLGKQRVEALQILRVNLGLTKGWRNHPAAVMWRGHDGYLYMYTNAMCMEWRRRGYKDTVQLRLQELYEQYDLTGWTKPWWWGLAEVHRSHRSNLKRKDPNYYTFNVKPTLPYVWPTQTIGQTKELILGKPVYKNRVKGTNVNIDR
jgi:hypothetical protein